MAKSMLKKPTGVEMEGPFVVPPYMPDPETLRDKGAVLNLYIPYVDGPEAVLNQEKVNLEENPFQLVWQKIQGRCYAHVTVDAEQTFTDSDQDLDKFYQHYVAFKSNLFTLETQQEVANGAAPIIAERIASAIPLRYDRVLLFHYGYDAARRCVDLHPGIRLNIHHGAYQYIGPRVGSERNGYVGNGTEVIYVHRRKDGMLCFDVFTEGLAQLDMIIPDPPQIGGRLDLSIAGIGKAFMRLIYPPQIDNITALAQAPAARRNATILGADTLDLLEKATEDYVKNGSLSGASAGAVALFFSGRASIVPEISYMNRSQRIWVPLGSTLRDILRQQFSLTDLELQQLRRSVLKLNMQRWAQTSLQNPDSGTSIYNSIMVGFDEKTTISETTGLTQWCLPILKGDDIKWFCQS